MSASSCGSEGLAGLSRRHALSLLVGGGVAALAAGAHAAPDATRLPAGVGTFVFDGWAGPPVDVWTWSPATVRPDTPIVFVMHGTNRDPDRYLREWTALAEAGGFLLAVPGFSRANFPGSLAYNWGWFQDEAGRPRPRKLWSFAVMEPLFDALRARSGSRVATYGLYGHSAGAQFVHRFVLTVPDARYSRAVSANAGSYTMPDLTVDYPFGLKNAPVTEASLKAALARPMTVLLGEADIDPNHSSLPRQPEAMRQGPTRFARGQAFFARAQTAAERLGAPLAWSLATVPGVGHSNRGMAPAAAPILTGRPA